MNKQEYLEYQETVYQFLLGLSHVSTGHCKGCEVCGGQDIELAEEPSFSWFACECCDSTLGGNRHIAHGIDKDTCADPADGEIVHLEVCSDCLYYINYGRLDDTTMAEIESGG